MTDLDRLATPVAELLCSLDQKRVVAQGCDILLCHDGYLPLSRDIVRTILQALREPSEGMLSAGDNCPEYDIEGKSVTYMASDGALLAIFRAMIDHILKGK